MPDYANIDISKMAPIYQPVRRAYEAGREVTAAGPQSTFATIQEPIDLTGLSQSELSELISRQAPEPEWTEDVDIDDMPEQDYDLGRLTIKRQYSDDVKIANAYMPGSPEFMALHQEASAMMQSRMAKLNVERDRVEAAFTQINRNPNFARNEKQQGKMSFYGENPVWKAPRVEYPGEPRPTFTQGYIEKAMGQLATSPDIVDREGAIEFASQKFGRNFAQEYPETLNIITEREKVGYDPLTPAGMQPAAEQALPEPEEVSLWEKWFGEEEEPEKVAIGPPAKKPIPIPGLETMPEPLSEQMFNITVGRLKATNPKLAKQYYDKWVSKW